MPVTRLLECKAGVTCALLGEQACPGLAIRYRAVWSAESSMAQWSCKLRTGLEIFQCLFRTKKKHKMLQNVLQFSGAWIGLGTS